MNHWQKLGLPVALGFCAAFLNWQSISRKLEPREYVAVESDVKAGQILGPNSFKKVSISHTASVDLQSALIPWSKKDALLNRFAQRTVHKNSLLTQFDIYEQNVAVWDKDKEDVLIIKQKDRPPYFINDIVVVRDAEGRNVDGFRVLSISPTKEAFNVRLAINSECYQTLKNKGLINTERLEVR